MPDTQGIAREVSGNCQGNVREFPTVNNIPDISLTCSEFPDISRFSRQVVTLSWMEASMGAVTDDGKA